MEEYFLKVFVDCQQKLDFLCLFGWYGYFWEEEEGLFLGHLEEGLFMEQYVEQLVVLVMLLIQAVSVVAIRALEAVWDQLFAEAVWAVSVILAELVLQVGLVLQVALVQV